MDIHNLIIIGSGPAGYTAGIYASRAQLNPVLFAGEINGGQLMNTTLVENWPGTKEGILGPDLMMEMRSQAEKFGTQIINKNVTKVDFSDEIKKVYVGETEYLTKTVIIATGAKAKMTGAIGEDRLIGRGVATCAVCDAAFYKERNTFVVGGGDAAIEDAIALTKFASKVTMLVRGETMRASKIMQKRALEHPKITVLYNSQLKEVKGEKKVESIVIANSQNQTEQEMAADGVFVAIGHDPITDIFKGQVELNDKDYLLTRLNTPQQVSPAQIWLENYPTMTSVPGVFGAGDVMDFRYRQAITSSASGCMAALDVEKYLQHLNK